MALSGITFGHPGQAGGGGGAFKVVPDLKGKTESEAAVLLAGTGLQFSVAKVEAGGTPGQVLDQDPPPNTVRAAGTAIRLFIITAPTLPPAGVAAKLDALQADTTALKADTATLKADTTSLKADTATLKADTGTVKADTAAVKADTAELKTRTGAVQTTVDAVATAVDAANEAVDRVETAVAGLETETKAAQRVQQILDKLDEISGKLPGGEQKTAARGSGTR